MKTLPKRHFEFNDKHDDFSTGMNTEQAQYTQRRQKHLVFKALSHTFLYLGNVFLFNVHESITNRRTTYK